MMDTTLNNIINQIEQSIEKRNFLEVKSICERFISLNSSENSVFISSQLTPSKLQTVRNLILQLSERVKTPVLSDLWQIIAFIYYFIGHFDKTIRCFQNAINCDPAMTEPLLNLGRLYREINQYGEAIECYNKATQIDKNKPEAWFYLGSLYAHQDEFDLAIKSYRNSIKINKNALEPWYNLGNLYKRLKRFDEAIECYKKAIELDKFSKTSWHNLGEVYFDLSQYDKAILCFKNVLEIDESDISTWYRLGDVYFNLRQYEQSVVCYKKVIKLDEFHISSWYNLGNTYHALKQYEQAILTYSKAIELDGSLFYPWNGLGNVQYDLHHYKQAFECYTKTIELNEFFPIGWYNLGNAYAKLDRNKQAVESYKKAIEIDNLYSAPWNGLGDVSYNIKEYDKAIESYEKSIKLDESSAYPWYGLGQVYFHINNYEQAIVCYEKAIQLDNSFASPWYYLGKIFQKRADNFGAHEKFAILEYLATDLNEFAPSLLDFYNDFHSPFLLKRIFSKIKNIDTYITYGQLLKTNLLVCQPMEAVIQKLYFEKALKDNNPSNELLTGILTHYMNDPVIAYRIFDEEIDANSPNDLMGQYYFMLSCENYPLAESESIKKFALGKATNYYSLLDLEKARPSKFTHSSEETLQVYYTGMIFRFCDMPEQAINCFNLIEDYIPAFCMKIGCLKDQGMLTENDENFQKLLTYEHNHKGILNLSEIPPINLENETFYEQLIKFIHIKEIQDIIPILLDFLPEDNDLKSKLTACCHFEFKEGEAFAIISASSLILQKQEMGKMISESLQKFLEECFINSFAILVKFSGEDLEYKLGNIIDTHDNKEENIKLVEYFYLRKSIDRFAKIRLTHWACLRQYKGKQLSEIQQTILKATLLTPFLYGLNTIVPIIPLLIHPLLTVIQEEVILAPLCKSISTFIEEKFIKDKFVIPENFIIFHDQFNEWSNQNPIAVVESN